MNNKLVLTILAIVIVVGAGGFLFWNMNKSDTNIQTQTANPTSAPVTEITETPAAIGGNEFIVEGGEFKFTPSEITVKKGEEVKITFKNTGSFPHDYVISDLGVSTKRLNPGEEETVEFTPEEAGQFEFICSVGNHEEQGMVGTLTVE